MLQRDFCKLLIGLSLASTFYFFESSSHASLYDMYRADYPKGAFCAAIAGACASDDNSENSYFQNPAALESSELGFNFDGDYDPSGNIEPGMKVSTNTSESVFLGGLSNTGKDWGLGLGFSGSFRDVKGNASLANSDTSTQSTVATENSAFTLWMNIPFAVRVKPNWSLGMSLDAIYYTETFTITGSPRSQTTAIDKLPQIGFTFGSLLWIGKKFRIGNWLRTPVTYYVKQTINTQAATTQININEDIGLHYPLIFSNGISWMPWEDKRTVLFDVDFIGTTKEGLERTLDKFSTISNSTAVLKDKGRSTAIEPHLAWRAPWWNGSKGTYTLGTYYENGRWENIKGRVHGVSSLAYDLGLLEAIVAVDVASDFVNLQISFR